MAADEPGFFPALLESQSYQEKTGVYDILFAAPVIEKVAYDQQQLEALLQLVDGPSNQTAGQHPFAYGWFVYFAYEAAYVMEPKLAPLLPESSQEPLAIAIYCQGSVVIDHRQQHSHVLACNQQVADELMTRLQQQEASLSSALSNQPISIDEIHEEVASAFTAAVTQAKQLIEAGDIYQANLSRQWSCELDQQSRAADVYAHLRQANPAPFAGMLQLADYAVVSSSPERLFSIRAGWLETRPIAGTRPRHADATADAALVAELINTPKERAEHIMLIDLERNDLGRVCETGTVVVDELMVIESYQHVHHIVSNVKGKLKAEVSVVDVLQSLFPGGTITGCPKIRCMQVIEQIEQRQRGCYTGSMGYINHDGQVDLNILIRTLAVDGNHITFNAGAGIVADSNPQAELQETRHKAKGLIRALSGRS